jgi:hypothetical protein
MSYLKWWYYTNKVERARARRNHERAHVAHLLSARNVLQYHSCYQQRTFR